MLLCHNRNSFSEKLLWEGYYEVRAPWSEFEIELFLPFKLGKNARFHYVIGCGKFNQTLAKHFLRIFHNFIRTILKLMFQNTNECGKNAHQFADRNERNKPHLRRIYGVPSIHPLRILRPLRVIYSKLKMFLFLI